MTRGAIGLPPQRDAQLMMVDGWQMEVEDMGEKRMTVQINPYVPVDIKEKIDARVGLPGSDATISGVVTTALRQYFGELDTQEDRLTVLQQQMALVLQSVNVIAQSLAALAEPVAAESAAPAAPVDWTAEGRVLPAAKRRGWFGGA